MSKPTVLIVSTLNTKLDETVFLRDQILAEGTCDTKVLDVGRERKKGAALLVPAEELVPLDVKIADLPRDLPRGEYINEAIKQCIPVVAKLVSSGEIHGIVAAGGSSGSSLATALMRNACPVGFPKLMVSTMASGDIKPYIEETDITMMYSVVDIAGMNSILRRILCNAATAIAAMTVSYAKAKQSPPPGHGKRIAITMFGNTTPCVDWIRSFLTAPPHDASDYEIYVFHATGAGGKAMERLITDGHVDAVIDVTTTEIADELFGGVLTAGPDRLEAAAKKGIPLVVSVGACDMVNFGPKSSVPDKYKDRKLFEHNPAVTLMRTSKEESAEIGKFIASKLKGNATKPENVRVLLPAGGVSMLDKKDQPFRDQEADTALFEAIETDLLGTDIEVEEHPEHINDEDFAARISKSILQLMGVDERTLRLSNNRRRRWSFDHGLG